MEGCCIQYSTTSGTTGGAELGKRERKPFCLVGDKVTVRPGRAEDTASPNEL
jgi:hypothetical protein